MRYVRGEISADKYISECIIAERMENLLGIRTTFSKN